MLENFEDIYSKLFPKLTEQVPYQQVLGCCLAWGHFKLAKYCYCEDLIVDYADFEAEEGYLHLLLEAPAWWHHVCAGDIGMLLAHLREEACQELRFDSAYETARQGVFGFEVDQVGACSTETYGSVDHFYAGDVALALLDVIFDLTGEVDLRLSDMNLLSLHKLKAR